ncbi:hypothetical protein MYX76_16930 [Desulfobacterota bacterium AH_259_B03_O07]|nr:hypothetical protein [Desulfobacterota bacterium AH_259_B03_O07]
MSRFLFLVSIIFFIASCSSIYQSRDLRPYGTKQSRKYEQKAEYKKPTKSEKAKPSKPRKKKPSKQENVINASFTDVWFATLEGIKWIKWSPAFIDEKSGEIILKEAYVYKKSGKILRTFKWPTDDTQRLQSIDDYLQTIAYYKDSSKIYRPVFSQESMKIKIIRIKNTKTKIDIDYKIRPYLDSAKFAEEIKSNNYIETVLLQKIKENLKDSFIDTT